MEENLRRNTYSYPRLKLVPHIEFINDKLFENINEKELIELIPNDYERSHFYIVDNKTFNTNEYLILCVDLNEIRGQKFRLTPNSMWDVDLNLFIANLNFEDYMLSLDNDNIYRTKV